MEMEYKNSLKNISFNHLMKDLIEDTIKNNTEESLFTLLIVDKFSSEILSSLLKVSDLLNKGILSIELINNKRNKFPNYNAIYFLSPSNESCNLLVNDFNDLDNPSYNKIFLFFTHKLPEDLLEKITTEGIIQHTVLIKEFNLSFTIYDENIFNLNFKSGLKIFKLNFDEEEKMIKILSHRIFTVLSILNIYPFIQYQNDSKLCLKLGNELQFILDNNNILNNKKKESILLLTDRSIDSSSPLLHNDNYLSLCNDLLNIKNMNNIEVNKDTIIKLSKEDELWNKLKLMNISSVFDELLKYFEIYKNQDNNNLSFIEMINYLKELINRQNQNCKLNISKVELLINQLYLAEKIKNKYKDNNIHELIEFERNFLLNEINSDIISKIFEIKKNISKEDYLRLLLILYINNNNTFKDIFNEERIKNDISKEENNIFNNLKYIIKNNTNDDKLIINDEYESKLLLTIKKALKFSLNEKNFPFINHSKEEIKLSSESFPLIVFNIGGISYNEIASVQKLSYNKLFFGSTNIINANEYINHLKNIEEENKKDIKIDCLEDYDNIINNDSFILNVNSNIKENNNPEKEDISPELQKLLEDENDYYI